LIRWNIFNRCWSNMGDNMLFKIDYAALKQSNHIDQNILIS